MRNTPETILEHPEKLQLLSRKKNIAVVYAKSIINFVKYNKEPHIM